MKKIFSVIFSLCLFSTTYGTALTTDCGNTVSITATPATGYHFTQWQDGNTDNPRQVEVKASANYIASFAPNDYTLTLSGENGVVTGAGSYEYGSVVTISATPLECYQFKQWSDGNTNATREITITDDIELEAIFEVITYTITIESANQEQGTVTIEVVGSSSTTTEYVDLGLSVKWATCNIGATKPEEYGEYFAWGETESSSRYQWANYKWSKMSSTNTDVSLTKYNIDGGYGTVDNKITLDQSDDVASVNLGDNWRIPTDTEMTELLEQCIWTWTTYNGVNGYNVTSKNNGNSIFLPAAGLGGYNGLQQVGNTGFYWSSSLYTDNPKAAYCLYFESDDVPERANIPRCDGTPIRPVCQ